MSETNSYAFLLKCGPQSVLRGTDSKTEVEKIVKCAVWLSVRHGEGLDARHIDNPN